MKKVTGIGGIFFKAEDPKKMQNWYDTNLGLNFQDKGYHSFLWDEDNLEGGSTSFSIFKKDTTYLDPSKSNFMLNFRVENLDALLLELKQNGINQIGATESFSYGKFAWILDPEGNKIELWEPIDEGFNEEK